MGSNGDCRIPRSQQHIYKMVRREEWDKLHKVSYELMCELIDRYEVSDTALAAYLERYAKEWRKYIALPTDVETWLEERRHARANEPID